MKKCIKCDMVYAEDKKFCKVCGSSLSQEDNIEPKELAKKTVFEEKLKVDPLNTDLLLEYAQFLYKNLLFKETISKLLIILAINQDQEQAKELLYKCYFKLNMYKEALDIGEKLLENKKTDIVLLEDLAEIESHLNNKEKVIQYCNTILKLQPTNSKALYNKALILLDQKEFEEATKILTQLYKEGSRDRIATIYAGVNECLLEQYQNTVETLTPILSKENISLTDIHNQRGFLYLTYSLCKIKSSMSEIDQWFNLLDFESQLDQEIVAKTVLEIIAIYFADLVEIRVVIIESFINRYINEASICFSIHTNSYAADIWNKIAEIQESANLLEEAQISLKKAIELNPDNIEYKEKQKQITEHLEEQKKKIKRHDTVFGISTILIIVILIASYFIYNRHIENKSWEVAKQHNTYESYGKYLIKYPVNRFWKEAKQLQEDALWIEVKKENTVVAYDRYFKQYPSGKYVVEFKFSVTESNVYGTLRYVGQIKNEQKEGIGIGIYELNKENWNGTYSGEWSNDKENGKGTFTSVSKDIYEGEWVNGKKHGFGKYYWPNGDIYEGRWVNGKKHGTCKYYSKRNNRWYFGKLNNGKGRLYDKSDRYSISFN